MSKALLPISLLLVAAGFVVTPYLIFLVAPIEPNQGFIQKIFYYHVPCAWVMLIAAIFSGVAGGIFLGTKKPWADRFSAACAEITVIFGITVMTTGPLWGKKAWGHYWVWDARLTTMLILFLTFIGVMLARRYSGPLGRKIAAGVALFGAINVPLVFVSVKLWKTNHPTTKVVPTLSAAMRSSLWLSVATFTLLFIVLLVMLMRVEKLRSDVDDMAVLVAEASTANEDDSQED